MEAEEAAALRADAEADADAGGTAPDVDDAVIGVRLAFILGSATRTRSGVVAGGAADDAAAI